MSKIRIISLGEIITPNISNTMSALALTISIKSGRPLEEITPLIRHVLHKTVAILENFKTGQINENTFNSSIIEELETATNVKLSIEEFDLAWIAMCPSYDEFKNTLKSLRDYNNTPGHTITFISNTNPKDMRHLIAELKAAGDIDYEADNNNLMAIGGIPLFTTFSEKQTKPELLASIFSQLKQINRPTSTLFTTPKVNIQYVIGVNQITEARLRALLDDTNNSLDKVAVNLDISTIIWDKSTHPSLIDFLNNNTAESLVIPIRNLK